MKKGFNIGVLILVLGFSVFLMVFSSKRFSHRKVSSIETVIHDEQGLFVTDEIVNNLLKQNGDSLKNQLNSELNLHNLEVRIAAHPLIKEALVYQDVNGGLGVEIFQKTPLLRLFVGGKSMYLDTDGNIMPWTENFSARVPVYGGNWDEGIQKEVFGLANWLQSQDFWENECVAIQWKENEGYVIQTRTANHQVILGSLEKMEYKLKKYEVFLGAALNQGLAKSYQKVNLKFNNQVVCSK